MSKLIDFKSVSKEDRKMLDGIFWRSFLQNAGYSGASKFNAVGYIISQLPAINRFYKDPEDRRKAIMRHNTWFNATNSAATLIMGITAAMEKENSEKEDFDAESVSAIKASLMGPISGIGDSLAWGVFLIIAQAIGISLAANGSLLGPIAFLLIYNIPTQAMRYILTYVGWNVGTSFFSQIYESGLMKVVTKACGILGLIMVGAMAANNVSFTTTLAMNVQGTSFPIQGFLDQAFLGLIPLLATLACLKLLQNKVSATRILFGIYVICIILGLLHVV
jgi:PTS system mannose-specific IID component